MPFKETFNTNKGVYKTCNHHSFVRAINKIDKNHFSARFSNPPHAPLLFKPFVHSFIHFVQFSYIKYNKQYFNTRIYRHFKIFFSDDYFFLFSSLNESQIDKFKYVNRCKAFTLWIINQFFYVFHILL